jgi:hypothetical protein
VRLAFKVVMQNEGDFVDAILLYREIVRYSASKERLGEACVLRHGIHHLQSCFFMITKRNYIIR